MTAADDENRLFAGAKPDAPRVPRAGELLYEFVHEGTRIRCELRDHGQYGVEAQILHDGELMIGRTFHQRLDPTRTPREMAIAWADGERKSIASDVEQTP